MTKNKCPNTLSGEHFWNFNPIKKNSLLSVDGDVWTAETLDGLETKSQRDIRKCLACNIIDDKWFLKKK